MTDLGLFANPGALFRCPGGNIEVVPAQQQTISWSALNIGRDPCVAQNPERWDPYRKLADGHLEVFPWMHCRSYEDMEFLFSIGHRWQSVAVGLNIEDVVGDKLELAEVAHMIEGQWGKQVLIPTLPWVQNEQGWHHLKSWVVALEIFPDENAASNKPQDCIDHAFAEGLEKVTLMFKTKSHEPADYDLSICHSFYTGDDIGSTMADWLRWDTTTVCHPADSTGGPPVPPTQSEWYEKPYLTGPPVGPEKLPRGLKAPSLNAGAVMAGDDVMAFKRAISRAGRLKPWAPATWSPSYGEPFAMGKGGGNVGDSGVRGFQRQQFPDDKSMQTGNIGDKTYQALRRARVSDPESPNFKKPLLDATAVSLLRRATLEFDEDARIAEWRKHVADFCERAEVASASKWTYDQRRPFTGLGQPPEENHVNDCSSYVVLAYYWGRTKSGLLVEDPSGYDYGGFGNTQDDLDGHPRVTSGNYLVGDLAHYGGGGAGHVTICRKAGTPTTSVWSSFGQEPKPEQRDLFYRPDFIKVVRPELDTSADV